MKFIQKNLIRSYTFDIGDAGLTVHIKDFNAEREFTIPYEKLPMENIQKAKISVPLFRRFAAICFFIAAACFWSAKQHVVANPLGFFFVFCGLALILLHRYYRLGYINYKYANGTTLFSVMQNKNSDAIQKKIAENWMRRLRELHAFIDTTKPPLQERNKIQWLKDKGIITPAEFAGMLEELKRLNPTGMPPGLSPTPVIN